MGDAYARYYAKNRDVLLARMRERYAARREAIAAEIAGGNENARQLMREKGRAKYVRHKQNAGLELLNAVKDKPILRPVAKAFIEEELIRSETYKKLPLSAIRALCGALESHD